MAGKRRNHSPVFKAKVALEALKGERTLNEIGAAHEVHPMQVSKWRKDLLDGASSLFERGVTTTDRERQEREDALLREIGRLQVAVSFLEKKVGKLP
jgi:transposase-like protein